MATENRAPASDEAVAGSWSGSAGSRYTLVDDYPDSGGADYLQHGTTAGDLTFGFTAFSIPAGSTEISVQVRYYDAEPSNGNNNIGGRLKVGGTYYNASTHNPSGANYTARSDNWATNPKTGAPWTLDDINGQGANALQAFGWRSTDANPAIRLASIELQVTYTPPAFSLDVSWAEMELPDAPRRLLLSWGELETPGAPRAARIAWAEIEAPNAPRALLLAWSEAEVPTAPRRADISWAELETPNAPAAPRQLLVAWAELETPLGPRLALIGWSEFQVQNPPRAALVSWGELELADAPRCLRIAWGELETGNQPRTIRLSWAEFEAPAAAPEPRSVLLVWAELEVPARATGPAPGTIRASAALAYGIGIGSRPASAIQMRHQAFSVKVSHRGF